MQPPILPSTVGPEVVRHRTPSTDHRRPHAGDETPDYGGQPVSATSEGNRYVQIRGIPARGCRERQPGSCPHPPSAHGPKRGADLDGRDRARSATAALSRLDHGHGPSGSTPGSWPALARLAGGTEVLPGLVEAGVAVPRLTPDLRWVLGGRQVDPKKGDLSAARRRSTSSCATRPSSLVLLSALPCCSADRRGPHSRGLLRPTEQMSSWLLSRRLGARPPLPCRERPQPGQSGCQFETLLSSQGV